MSNLYVSDLDGTLLRSNEVTSEYTNSVINSLVDKGMILMLYHYKDNLHSIWANQELYRKGNSDTEFYGILEKNMRPVYDSARRQGYDVWERRLAV